MTASDTISCGPGAAARVLWFDTSKARRQSHHSGLRRVSTRLLQELAGAAGLDCRPARWSALRGGYVETASGRPVGRGAAGAAFFTPEVFALRERPLCRRWLGRFGGVTGTLFYDAIPFFNPLTAWPRSVRRFPAWYRDLQAYRRVLFISEHARAQAWEVSRLTGWPEVNGPVVPLGCDYAASPPPRVPADPPVLLNVGILEPRKGQACLMEACERLWGMGLRFRLVLLGRVNPRHGRPLAQTVRRLQAAGRDLVHEADGGDDRLAYWHQRAALVVQPTRAEGFGLPVVEALWAGCPVLCTEQPSLEEVPGRRGVRVLREPSVSALEAALGALLRTDGAIEALRARIGAAALPRWRDTARRVAQELGLAPSS